VIAHCNKTAGDHAQECAKGGMDDKEFKKVVFDPPRRPLGLVGN
jgi:hypothetical protein